MLGLQPLSPADALRQMIVDDRPLDAELVRICVCKLCHGSSASDEGDGRNALEEALCVLNQGVIFCVLARLLSQLRTEALAALAAVEQADRMAA